MAIVHSTAADASFSATGETAWEAFHDTTFDGLLKGENGDIVQAIAGTDYEVPSTSMSVHTGIIMKLSPL